jgi:hypothetical protein
MSEPDYFVTDHAATRYIERWHKVGLSQGVQFDMDNVRAVIRRMVQAAKPLRARASRFPHMGTRTLYAHDSGAILVVCEFDRRVVTVLAPEHYHQYVGKRLKAGGRLLPKAGLPVP